MVGNDLSMQRSIAAQHAGHTDTMTVLTIISIPIDRQAVGIPVPSYMSLSMLSLCFRCWSLFLFSFLFLSLSLFLSLHLPYGMAVFLCCTLRTLPPSLLFLQLWSQQAQLTTQYSSEPPASVIGVVVYQARHSAPLCVSPPLRSHTAHEQQL